MSSLLLLLVVLFSPLLRRSGAAFSQSRAALPLLFSGWWWFPPRHMFFQINACRQNTLKDEVRKPEKRRVSHHHPRVTCDIAATKEGGM